MRRRWHTMTAGIFAAALIAGAGMAQEKVKVKYGESDDTMTVKGANEKVKIKKSGSSYKVKGTGEKFKMKEKGSGYKVKGTDVILKPSKSSARKASKSAARENTFASATPRVPRVQSTPAVPAPASVAGAGEMLAPEAR